MKKPVLLLASLVTVTLALVTAIVACGPPDKPPLMPDTTDPPEGLDAGAPSTPPTGSGPVAPPPIINPG